MSKHKRFVCVGDNHGNEINYEARDALFRAMDEWKPDIVIHAGDNWNFSYLRRGASLREEDDSADSDWQEGGEFFRDYFSYGKEKIFLWGNHDMRLVNTRDNTTKEAVRRHAEQGIRDIESMARKYKVKMLPYESRLGVHEFHGVKIIHGYACGVGGPRKLASVYGSCFFAHMHSADIAVVERHPEPAIAIGTGCLLNIDQGYNATQLNKLRHENSWLQGEIIDGKAVTFQVKRASNGKFYAPADIVGY